MARAGDEKLNTEVGVNHLEPKKPALVKAQNLNRKAHYKLLYERATKERDEEIGRILLECGVEMRLAEREKA